MRKLYLTIGANATDPQVKPCHAEARINIGELFDKYPEALFHVFNQKLVAILKYLDNSSGDVLIANAADSIDNYLKLKDELVKRGIFIERVFIKIPTYTSTELNEMYESSPRPEYSRKELQLIAIDYEESLKTLGDQIKKSGDEVTMILADVQ